MGAEQPKSNEKTGISVSLAPTIVIATFTMLNKGPHGEENFVDVQRGNTAVWLTTPSEAAEDTHMVIGVDGAPSPMGVMWTPDGPRFVREEGRGLIEVPCERRDEVTVANMPEGERAFVLARHYPGLVECYTVFQVPQDGSDTSFSSFAPYIGRNQLVSGMYQRGLRERLTTSFASIRITDGTGLPYGRELKSPKA